MHELSKHELLQREAQQRYKDLKRAYMKRHERMSNTKGDRIVYVIMLLFIILAIIAIKL